MKNQIFLFTVISFTLLVSCRETGTPILTPEKFPTAKTIATNQITSRTQLITPTIGTAHPSPSETLLITRTPMAQQMSIPNITQTALSNRNFKIQCLDISPSFSGNIQPSGNVILGGGVGNNDETIVFNMDTGHKNDIVTLNEFQLDHVVSLDRKLMAYQSVIVYSNGKINKSELVIANADGARMITIAWDKKWLDVLGWTTDRRLLISFDETYIASDGHEIPYSYMVFDPFSGKQELLQPNFPGFLHIRPPFFWMGEKSFIVDPTVTRMIYPQLLPDNNDLYTLILWDETTKKQVAGLETIYQNGVGFSQTTSLPRWSPDGSQFALLGQIVILPTDVSALFELYRVGRDGGIEQLTNLTSFASIVPFRFSWSPDGKHIAMLMDYLNPSSDTHLAVVDVNTHVVTDYCVTVNGDQQIGAPIWSPDGTQLLVMDETDTNQRVILVDIVKNYAAVIAENYGVLGWMVAP